MSFVQPFESEPLHFVSAQPGYKARNYKMFEEIFDLPSWISIIVFFAMSLVFIRLRLNVEEKWQHTLGIIGGLLMQGVQDKTSGCPKR